ncbi:MAG: cbb3-type cytochrome c oxidase subunit I [Gemmatimonadaceae bacterium]|nr:cbb3-type cytochrome c oxidase subunit I [Gemmatimonadaceae bacterium]
MSTTTGALKPREVPEIDARSRRLVTIWLATMLAAFVVMVILGITMRLNQGAAIKLMPNTFYALMTMHGLGMAGGLFTAGVVLIWYLTALRFQMNHTVMWVCYVLVLIGVVGVLAATLVGHFAAGWYALYPLPFVNAAWPSWTIGTTIVSLMILGVAWLVMQMDIMRVLAAGYGLKRMFGLEYYKGEPAEPLPPAVMITAVCATAGILGTVVGAATLIIYLFKWVTPATQFDPLLLKNTMFMFGHTIVNVAMYCGLGVMYQLMPAYTKRPWKVNRLLVISWNATLVFILFAYFHHLYMDFAQPKAIQILGQIASYGSALPATAVTIFGVGSQLYRSGIKWTLTPFAFMMSVVGWGIGGAAAVIDATIAVNRVFHNTLWVPAHFHTYFLVGFVLILFGFLHHHLNSRAERLAGTGFVTMLVGGYGFVLMFYLGGLSSVPRRYADYSAIPLPSVSQPGTHYALWGALFASLFLLGALVFFLSNGIGRRSPGEAAVAGAGARG